jgi:hypothetical protein
MNEIVSVWCFVLCLLAIWAESLRSVRAMGKKAEAFHAFHENSGRRSEQNLLVGKMQHAADWTEQLPENDFTKPGRSGVLAEKDSQTSIKLNSPWLYLLLILVLCLLVL